MTQLEEKGINLEVTYSIDELKNSLTVEYKATTSTPINIELIQNPCFNLNGKDSNIEISNHELKLNSNYYFNENGTKQFVGDTLYDYRDYVELRSTLNDSTNIPFEKSFFINQPSGRRYLAR